MGRKRKAVIPDDSSRANLPPCRICGAPGAGFHYGANTCEACKGFFHRSFRQHTQYRCEENNDCIIEHGQGRLCQLCRYKKCLSFGMAKEAIKTGRYTSLKRTSDILEVKSLENKALVDRIKIEEPSTSASSQATFRTCLLDPIHQAHKPVWESDFCERTSHGFSSDQTQESLSNATKAGTGGSETTFHCHKLQTEESSRLYALLGHSTQDWTAQSVPSVPSIRQHYSKCHFAKSTSPIHSTAEDCSSIKQSSSTFGSDPHNTQSFDYVNQDPLSSYSISQHSLSSKSLLDKPYPFTSNVQPSPVISEQSTDSSIRYQNVTAAFTETHPEIISQNSNLLTAANQKESPSFQPDLHRNKNLEIATSLSKTVADNPTTSLFDGKSLTTEQVLSPISSVPSVSSSESDNILSPKSSVLSPCANNSNSLTSLCDYSVSDRLCDISMLYDNKDEVITKLMDAYQVVTTQMFDGKTHEEMIQKREEYFEQITLKKEMFGRLAHLPDNQFDEIFEKTGIDADDRQERLLKFIQHTENWIQALVKFSKSVPGFSFLDLNEKVTLIRNSRMEFFLSIALSLADCGRHILFGMDGSFKCELDIPIDRHPDAKNTLHCYFEFVRTMRNLQLTDEETVVLNSVILVSPGNIIV